MSNYTEFMGRDGFIWFVGVVEDRQDPLKLGRVRVRCLGYHTENVNELPTSDLPWASPLLPITSSGINGIGQTPLGLLEGSWVVGFFKDADTMQDAVILGSLAGKPTSTGAEAAAVKGGIEGFRDPNGVYPRYKDESDVNRLARNDTAIPLNISRAASRTVDIPTANILPVPLASDITSTTDASLGDTWSQPEIAHNSVYPYNHVFESESGHVTEFDDSVGTERILFYHRKGTEIEMLSDGTRSDIVKGSAYAIVEKDNAIYIKGKSDITLGGRHKIIINADGAANNSYDIQVGPNANVNIQVDKGDINLTSVEGNINMFANNDLNMNVGGTYTLRAGQIVETSNSTTTRSAQGEYHTYGSPIDHN